MTCGFVVFLHTRAEERAQLRSQFGQAVAALASPGMESAEQSFVTSVAIRTPFIHLNCAPTSATGVTITPFTRATLALALLAGRT